MIYKFYATIVSHNKRIKAADQNTTIFPLMAKVKDNVFLGIETTREVQNAI